MVNEQKRIIRESRKSSEMVNRLTGTSYEYRLKELSHNSEGMKTQAELDPDLQDLEGEVESAQWHRIPDGQ